MSLKENVEMVREELNSEEKFFESAVKTERFVKKYKTLLISGVVVLVLGIASNAAYKAKVHSEIVDANEALAALEKNVDDKSAQDRLKSLNPDLYDAWQLSVALKSTNAKVLESLKNSKAIAISDIASYQQAVYNRDIKSLEAYSMKPEAIYKDMALFELAVLLMEDNRADEAHAKLQSITKESPIYKYAKPLMHYGIK